MSYPKIAIIGAGPVGTTLARLLFSQSPSPSVTVFEGDLSPNYRSQGGTLDLHTATGLAAVKEAGLWDEFLKHARYDGESMLVTDNNLKVYHKVEPNLSPEAKGSHAGGRRPEIDRAALRQMLVESLPPDMIRWGHRLREVRPGKDDPRSNELVFALPDGTTTTLSGFDLVVGAEGAWSKVRSALTDVRPVFSGVGHQAFEIPDGEKNAPEVHRLINRGSVFSSADSKRVSLQQIGDGSLLVALTFRTDDADWFKNSKHDARDLEQAKAACLGQLEGWHPTIREAVSRAQGQTTPRSLFMLPVGFSFEHRAGLTVVGDAAHLMTPFAGEGVNVGMEDARLLARAIAAAAAAAGEAASPAGLDGEVAAFEKEMFARAEKFAALTEAMLHNWFHSGGPPDSVIPKAIATLAGFHAP